MGLTNQQLQDELAVILGTGARSGDALRTSFQRWINNACKKIAYAHAWDQRRREQIIITVAPYSTGTAAVTILGTTVTCTGSTLVSGMAGRKFALAIGGPYYRITSVNVGAGTFVIPAYQEATVTASAFVIFQDEYDLAATTHTVEDVTCIKDTFTGPVCYTEQRNVNSMDYVGSSTARPIAWAIVTSTAVGTPRIRLLPIPDAIYRICIRYLTTWVAMSTNADLYTDSLPEDVEELIIDRALRWAPRVEGSRRVMTDEEFRRELQMIWSAHHKARYRIGQRKGLTFGGVPRILVNTSAL